MSLIRLDHLLRAWVVAHRVAALNGPLWLISILGGTGAVWLLIAAGLAAARRISWTDVLRLVLALVAALVICDGFLKPAVGRLRPFVATPDIRVIGARPLDASFPSGHATAAFAGAMVLATVAPAGRALWWALACAIAYARVYLGVHYPVDVIGGAAIGAACATAVMRLTALNGQETGPRDEEMPKRL